MKFYRLLLVTLIVFSMVLLSASGASAVATDERAATSVSDVLSPVSALPADAVSAWTTDSTVVGTLGFSETLVYDFELPSAVCVGATINSVRVLVDEITFAGDIATNAVANGGDGALYLTYYDIFGAPSQFALDSVAVGTDFTNTPAPDTAGRGTWDDVTNTFVLPTNGAFDATYASPVVHTGANIQVIHQHNLNELSRVGPSVMTSTAPRIVIDFDNSSCPNNAPTAVNTTASITTSAVVGSTVVPGVSIDAVDPDFDPVSYALTGGNGAGYFAIDSSTGAITLAGVPAAGTYVLSVEVSDGRGGTVTVTSTVSVAAPGKTSPNAGTLPVTGNDMNDLYFGGLMLLVGLGIVGVSKSRRRLAINSR